MQALQLSMDDLRHRLVGSEAAAAGAAERADAAEGRAREAGRAAEAARREAAEAAEARTRLAAQVEKLLAERGRFERKR